MVPTAAMRAGNFSSILTCRTLATVGGVAVPENTIYDPQSDFTASNGLIYRNAFPGNIIPPSRVDPVALRIQAYVPLPQTSGVINNYLSVYPYAADQMIPRIKVDHNIDFRCQRRTDEELSLARSFPIREHMTFSIRGEFFNVLNRANPQHHGRDRPAGRADDKRRNRRYGVRLWHDRDGHRFQLPSSRADRRPLPVVRRGNSMATSSRNPRWPPIRWRSDTGAIGRERRSSSPAASRNGYRRCRIRTTGQ
jgi:hypothetical protein